MRGRLWCVFAMLLQDGGDDFCHLQCPRGIRVDFIREELGAIQKGAVQVDDRGACEAGDFFDLGQNLIFDKSSVNAVPVPDEGGDGVHQPDCRLAR